MSTDIANLNLDAEQLSEVVKTWDKLVPCPANTREAYYILAETAADNAGRVVLKDLKTHLPLEDLRRRKPDYQNRKNLYIDVEGDYFPDLIGVEGIFLVSEAFLEYLKNTIHLRKKYIYNYIGLCTSANERIETYCLLVPPQLDCILPGSIRYDQNHTLTYFEIDETKVGKAEIFRVKGFSQLIVTQPLNRMDYTGYECNRIENYFNYAGARDRDYQERCSGQRLTTAIKEYERRASVPEYFAYKSDLTSRLELRVIRQEAAAGMRRIFDGYQGSVFPAADLTTRKLTFHGTGADGKFTLTAAGDFSQPEFTLSCLPKATAYLKNLPEALQAAGRQVIYETVLAALIQEGRIFDTYANLHGGARFRLYCTCDFYPTTNPPLIYDFQSPAQRSIPLLLDWNKFTWSGKDLREFDFSGQTLNGLKIVGANLAGAKFNGCSLNNTEFCDCDLTGAEFKQAKMQGAKFLKCELNRTNYDNAEMPKAELIGSDLIQCSFNKTNLSDALIKNRKLSKAYFNRARLTRARFQIRMTIFDMVFRLCDLRSAQFNGEVRRTVNIMSGCDFSNSDLSGCQFALNRIAKSNFTKTKLIEADFSKCHSIGTCNFKGTNCAAMDLDGLQISECNFTKVDLSTLKPKSGATFVENNNFTYANFSGYDFAAGGYLGPNNFKNANLSDCNLIEVDLSNSNLLNANVKDANMEQTVLEESQLEWVQLSPKQREEIRLLEEDEDDENENDTDNDGMDETDDIANDDDEETETDFEMDGDE